MTWQSHFHCLGHARSAYIDATATTSLENTYTRCARGKMCFALVSVSLPSKRTLPKHNISIKKGHAAIQLLENWTCLSTSLESLRKLFAKAMQKHPTLWQQIHSHALCLNSAYMCILAIQIHFVWHKQLSRICHSFQQTPECHTFLKASEYPFNKLYCSKDLKSEQSRTPGILIT